MIQILMNQMNIMKNTNLIGISGRLGHGKDAVGNIIQYLYTRKGLGISTLASKEDFENFIKNGFQNKSSWEVKKFADKLKDIVCMLIGCTREQLEDRDFKEKELGEEWDKWMVKLPLSVKYFTSQDQADFYIKNEHPLKHFKSTQNLKPELIKITPRLLLQILGTQAGRDLIHPNIWVNSLMSEYKPLSVLRDSDGNKIYDEKGNHQFNYPSWIITDTRFPNELEAIKSRGGITIRVNRPFYYRFSEEENVHVWSQDLEEKKKVYKINGNKTKEESYKIYTEDLNSDAHESETALDNAEFDHIIENNGTMEELIEKVRNILLKEKIL